MLKPLFFCFPDAITAFFAHLYHPKFILCSTNDPHRDVESVLTGYKKEPESEPQLEKLLPHINSSFSPDKSVAESVEELKKCSQSGDAAGNLL
jgi:hypothetical protein